MKNNKDVFDFCLTLKSSSVNYKPKKHIEKNKLNLYTINNI